MKTVTRDFEIGKRQFVIADIEYRVHAGESPTSTYSGTADEIEVVSVKVQTLVANGYDIDRDRMPDWFELADEFVRQSSEAIDAVDAVLS